MDRVGIFAANIIPVCSPIDMLDMFWDFKSIKILQKLDNEKIVTDRLYKRYLRFEQIDCALKVLIFCMNEVKNETTMSIIKHIIDGVEYTRTFYEKFSVYKPIRIGITEITSFEDQFRDLSEYDNLQGPPFWLREYLQEYPDTVLPFE